MSFVLGMRLADRYVLTDRIGVGRMGEVWRATDEVLGRAVAVRVLALPLAAAATLRAGVRREARAAAGLAHPHVTQVFDYGETTLAGGVPVPYLVMELVEGQSLDAVLVAGPLPWLQAVRVGAEVAGALTAAHQLGVVHRDVKPGNVMLTSRGAKVLDFGIAALADGQAAVDPAADVYSLGALLHECLIGRPPRRIDSGSGPVAAPVPPVEVPGLPAEVATIVGRCLDPDPTRRPSSMELAQVLGAAVGRPTPTDATLPTVTTPLYGLAAVTDPTMIHPSLPEADLVPASPGRRPRPMALIAVLAAVAAAGLVVLLIAAGLADGRTPAAATPSPSAHVSSPPPTQAISTVPEPTDAAGVLAALQTSIDAGVTAGDLDAGTAQSLRKMAQDLNKRSGRGNHDQVGNHAHEALAKIDELAQEGRISRPRAAELRALLQPLATQQDEG